MRAHLPYWGLLGALGHVRWPATPEDIRRVCIYFKGILDSFQGNSLQNQDVYADNRSPRSSYRAPQVNPRQIPGGGERLATARSGRTAGHQGGSNSLARPGPCRHMLCLFLPVFFPTACAFDIRERQGVINIQLCLLTIGSHI